MMFSTTSTTQTILGFARSLRKPVLSLMLLAIVATPSAVKAQNSKTKAFAKRIMEPDLADIGTAELKEVDEAVERFANRDFEKAKEYLERAHAKNSKLAPPDVLMARLFMATKNGGAARNALERAARDNPKDPEPYLIFGQVASQGRRVTDAFLLYQHTLKLAKAFDSNKKRQKRFLEGAYGGVAITAIAREDWNAAKAAILEWKKINPESATPLQLEGQVLFQLEKYRDAYEAFQAAEKIDDKLPPAEVRLARLYESVDDSKNAQTWIKYAATQRPTDAKVLLAVAHWMIGRGQITEGRKHADAAMAAEMAKDEDKRSEAGLLQAMILSGVGARMAGDVAAAELVLTKAHHKAPSAASAINQLALSLASSEDEATQRRGLQYAQLNARMYPYNANNPTASAIEAATTLAWITYKLDFLSHTQKILQTIGNRITTSPDGTYYFARILSDSKEKKTKEDARKLLEAILKSKRTFVERANAEKLLAKISKELRGSK